MDFQTILHNSVSVTRMIDKVITADLFIPNQYTYNLDQTIGAVSSDQYLQLGGGGYLTLDTPFAIQFTPFDGFIVLYTERGGGRIKSAGQTISMTEDFFYIRDCNVAFELESLILPWTFKILFITGQPLSLYRPFLKQAYYILPKKENPSVLMYLNRLMSFPSCLDLGTMLSMHQTLTNLISSYCTLFLPQTENLHPNLPSYLSEMKLQFDQNYMENFSLESCELKYNVNRYRICREFANTFGDPPLRYLNKKRIEVAIKLLLTTQDSVQEVSIKVGYESVTHFINQFKKWTFDTPQSFRLKVQNFPHAVHYFSQ